MSLVTTLIDNAGTLFEGVAGLAIIVTGFFLGRKWVKRA